MLMSYVSRANRVGVNRSGIPSNASKIGDEVVQGVDLLRDNMRRELRNLLIGNLIIRSVYDGLLVRCCDFDGDQIPNHAWETHPLNEEDRQNANETSLIVPELGIVKTYRNTWRNQAL